MNYKDLKEIFIKFRDRTDNKDLCKDI